MIPLNLDDIVFPDRKDLKKTIQENNNLYEDIKEQVQKIELDKINFEKEDYVPKSVVTQKQKVYFWIRVYLKEEIKIEANSSVKIIWEPSNEVLTTKFICYAKKGLDKDLDEQVAQYNTEDDKKVLCLMVEEDRININNEDIPFIKTLFKIGRFFQRQIWRREDMTLIDESGNNLPWFDIDF